MYTNSQEDIVEDMEFEQMWTPDYTAQNQRIENRLESIQNEICKYKLDNTDNPLERNMIFGSQSALVQLNL